MIIVDVGSETFTFNNSSDAEKHINKSVKAHLSHPFFFNVEKINACKVVEDKHFYKDNYSAAMKAYNRRRKLEDERDEYLSNNNITEPEKLKVTIKHC